MRHNPRHTENCPINANDPWDVGGLYGITPLGLKGLTEIQNILTSSERCTFYK
jgi:hypothetical protein